MTFGNMTPDRISEGSCFRPVIFSGITKTVRNINMSGSGKMAADRSMKRISVRSTPSYFRDLPNRKIRFIPDPLSYSRGNKNRQNHEYDLQSCRGYKDAPRSLRIICFLQAQMTAADCPEIAKNWHHKTCLFF